MQEPFVLKWQQLPTATSNARVRQTLAAALSPGHGCLSLQEIPVVSYISAKCLTGAFLVIAQLTACHQLTGSRDGAISKKHPSQRQ